MTDRASSAAAAHVIGGGAFVRYDGEGADEDVARVRIVVVFEDDDDDESSDDDDVVKAKAFTHRRLVFVVVVALAGRLTSSPHRRNLQFASECVVDIDIARLPPSSVSSVAISLQTVRLHKKTGVSQNYYFSDK